MIIATGSVDINEATKIAQLASTNASDLADKIKNIKTSLDGTITESTSTPFDDGKKHNDGDMWVVMNGNSATSMYFYSGGSWTLKKWDVTSLAVEYLSALSANLGNVQAGNINGVNISGSTINGGTITIDSGIDKFTMSNSGFEASNIIDGDTTDIYGGMISLAKGNTGTVTLDSVKGINSNGLSISGHTIACSDNGDLWFETNGGGSGGDNRANMHTSSVYSNGSVSADGSISANGNVSGNGLSISGHTMACNDGGALYFEKYNGGGNVADIHADGVYSKGTRLKSALSAKRDISEYSPDEALSAVMNTDVKKWKYKDADNSVNSQHIGPIIDDVNAIGKKSASIANEMVSTDENGNYYLDESNTISILLAALKKSNQRIDELSYRITQLERKNVQ